MKVYVDDMIVKSCEVENHVKNHEKVFTRIKKYDIRLNLEKCVFSVRGGKCLGFMVTNRGIEANPDKFEAILKMVSLTKLKEPQR